MHPAWAGAGGNWSAIDEVFDPSIVQQQDNLSCGAACGEMLLRDYGLNISQAIDVFVLIGTDQHSFTLAVDLDLIGNRPIQIVNADAHFDSGFQLSRLKLKD